MAQWTDLTLCNYTWKQSNTGV